MASFVLKADGVGKRYRIGLTHAGSLGELTNRWGRRLRGLPPVAPMLEEDVQDVVPVEEDDDESGVIRARMGAAVREGSKDFWSLRDISFEIEPGEVVGIVGRNGAGKSTLLKILSRVTTPTVGTVEIAGRVGCLLEVGTGFHPELTGRENIYMNATLLGMNRREVDSKLDEIVDFSGVEQFLDTPVKRYSSGMTVRLGFAVAAHLEPEVLIIDEVLAVGDADFQRKCLGKMEDVAQEGRTVLFVSHHMGAISRLCGRTIVLEGGRKLLDGDTEEVIREYLGGPVAEDEFPRMIWKGKGQKCGHGVWLHSVQVNDAAGQCEKEYFYDRDVLFTAEFTVTRPLEGLRCGFGLRTMDAVEVGGGNREVEYGGGVVAPGRYRCECRLPGETLNDGDYTLYFGMDKAPYAMADAVVKPLDIATVRLRFRPKPDVVGRQDRIPGFAIPKFQWSFGPS